MAFKKVEVGEWKPANPNDSIEGRYVGKDEGIGKFNSIAYHLVDSLINGVAAGPVTMWGSAVINQGMAGVKEGDWIKAVYTGSQPSQKGADTKLFDIFVDADKADTSVVAQAQAQAPAQPTAQEEEATTPAVVAPIVRPGEQVPAVPGVPTQ